MNRDQRLKLVDILVDNFTADELRSLVFATLGADAYETLGGTSKVGRATSLLERLESTGRIGELIDLIEGRRPDIELPDFEGETEPDSLEWTDDTDGQERPKPTSSPSRQMREVSPESAARMRNRRPGYDKVHDLVQKYDGLSPDERAQMSVLDLSDSYVQPMFLALGWDVLGPPMALVSGEITPSDLELEYRDIGIHVEVKRAGESLNFSDSSLRQWLGDSKSKWGILTNFETVRIWDLRDPNRPSLYLETSPWSYVADDRKEDDLLAAQVFYERLVRPPSEEPSSAQPFADMTKAAQIVADVETGILTPAQALDFACMIPDSSEQAEALVKLAPHLSESLLQEALATAREIGDAVAQAQALEGLAPYLPEDLRGQVLGEAKAARAAAPEPSAQRERAERIEIAVRALADSPSEVDLLGFSDYAKALADFIRSEKTEKPLTIGIDAAWGMGKTTLMHMVRKQLIEPQKGKEGVSFLTVWFNAWKYDQEESLWAALALQILAEVKKQFSWWQRTGFWWKLNNKRLEWILILRNMLKLLVSVLVVYLLGAVVLGIATIWLGTGALLKYVNSIGILGLVAAIYAAGKDIYDRLAGPFDLKLSEYVRKPDYKERIGFLAEFEEDFQRVVKVVTRDGKWPLVVFIDDLDRCAPPKPAEIIEAINILLGAKHCVFVLGMDAQAVACSIEAKYKDLCERLDDADDPGGLTLGQRFLEKIVQINFRIPRADSTLIESFVDANLGLLGEESSEKPRKEEVRAEAEQLIEAEQRAGKPLDEAVEVVKIARPDMSQEIVAEAGQEVFARSFDDSEDVKRAIYEAVPYLECNPRKIKRFINVFRLRALIANRRGLLEGEIIRLDLLAKWMIIAMRWPDFARAALDDENWIASLVEAHDIQENLIGPSALTADDQRMRNAQSRLDLLLTDPRVKCWMDVDDLVELLKGITAQTGWNLSNYSQLAQTVSEGYYKAGGTGLS